RASTTNFQLFSEPGASATEGAPPVADAPGSPTFMSLTLPARQLLCGAAGADQFRAASAGIDQTAEDLDVQPRRRRRCRVPLDAQPEPVLALRFDGLDDPSLGRGADP